MSLGGNGPRDWSPDGYWDEAPKGAASRTAFAPPPVRAGRWGWPAAGAVVLGLVACVLPFAASGGGWLLSTVGLFALGLAIGANRASRARRGRSSVASVLGGVLGVLGFGLSLWTVAAAFLPDLPRLPAPPWGPTAVGAGDGGLIGGGARFDSETLPGVAPGTGIPAQIDFLGTSASCGIGDDCWAWTVTPAEDCALVQIEFALYATEGGEPVARSTGSQTGWAAGVPVEVVLSIAPQSAPLAAITALECASA
ncbi:hypothetical protein [Agromyces seonyuensis]|uniref:Uncharacterized protein n=1 Tax=Agromyces seonyuensis TaxID=2662446 RepID=A0A6I4NVA8_9MICO|nr:hypothetical protein [Agromyces seonyuensis]MWB97012.1 hypothetical protein [Agromyces seonyuensis]